MAKQTITAKVSDKYSEGAILVDSFGWEQTNYDFYCIVERNGDYVKVLPMLKKVKSAGECSMATFETPTEIDYSAKPIRKKIKIGWQGEEIGFTFRNYSGGGWCGLWDGKVKTATHYA